MLAPLIACVGLIAAAASAFALEPCFADSVGAWRGPVLNGAGVETMESEFHVDADGSLVGSYHVQDAMPFDGTLTSFHQTDTCSADFTWTDHFGSGIVHIHFQPELGRFLGHWGMSAPLPWLIFDGYRTGQKLTS